ncbi:tyrosine-protein phosphatase [Cupriavidus sp. TMH.W2]|uniref:tyrosine-protein phosphatase n=1 Tax=Cupriavidus sp. TMH.W2 TaxID=3434465 RepID=UPI003D77B582
MISITNPGATATLRPGWGSILRVQFSDAEYVPGDIGRRMTDGRPFDPAMRGFPTQTQAQAIRQFCEGVYADPALVRVLVHCHAGKRRSGAVALYLVERFGATIDGPVPDDPNRTLLALLRDPTWPRTEAARAGWRSIWPAARRWLRG